MNSKRTTGYLMVVLAYITWGILPLYWALLSNTPPLVILFHRVLWSTVLFGLILVRRQKLLSTLTMIREPQIVKGALLSAALLCTNWLTYLYAMTRGQYIQASIGYFICPLLMIGLGLFLCKERLSIGEKLAVGWLILGVSIPLIVFGSLPWLALLLASSWSLYTLTRKRTKLPALEAVFLDTLLLVIPLGTLVALSIGVDSLMPDEFYSRDTILLFMAGVVTALPQLALVTGLRVVPLKFIGVTQYIAPSLALLLAVTYQGKTPSTSELLCVALIWIGITTFFCADAILRRATWLKRRLRRRLHLSNSNVGVLRLRRSLSPKLARAKRS